MNQERMDFRRADAQLDSTFNGVPPVEAFPPGIRPAITRYEEVTDRAGDLLAAALDADSRLETARRKDIDEIEEAFKRGEEAPKLKHAEAAKRASDEATAQFRAYQRIHKSEAQQLRNALLDQADTITRHVHGNVSAAITDYANLLNDYEKALTEAASNLEQKAAMIAFAADLRKGERHNLGIGSVPVPTPSTAGARNTLAEIRKALDTLNEPVEPSYIHVVGANDEVQRMRNYPQVRSLIDTGHLRYATDNEIREYESTHT